ncbi:hypothetical protein HIM_08207 [Hirsutella minnesotensis 3608]|uniref:Exonuclease domain-containing protein n=1 Tax=Hirsutella minnesotensis 3608 TaxID=1043627 RepID=A0A0F8A3T8_9HYPO|nr:hypothetical protein HIM_08207 [Hirsutella minnesotensis 3608]
MEAQYGPIPESPDNVQRLRQLVLSTDKLQKAGYVLSPLSSSELEKKRRCERCTRVLKPPRKDKPSGAKTSIVAPNASTSFNLKQARHVHATSAEEAQSLREFDQAFEDLTISLPAAPSKPAEVVLRCKFHPGIVANRKWTCCGNFMFAKPCAGEELHHPRQYTTGELEENWSFHITPLAPPASPRAAAVAIDCEMGTAASGESELIRVSVIDYFSRRILLDSLVWPDVKMAHYNTRFSGISKQVMDDACRRRRCLFGRAEARRAVWRFVGPDTVVIGHALHQDLTSLRWIHPLVVDTLILEKTKRGLELQAETAKAEKAEIAEQGDDQEPGQGGEAAAKNEGGLSLKMLAAQRLNRAIQIKGRGHDSVEDALATRDLLHWHVLNPVQGW